MIEQLTANHFIHDNKTYFVNAKVLKMYNERKTLRNLLSKARLLDDSEASTVKPTMAHVLVTMCDGEIKYSVTETPRREVEKLNRVYTRVIVLFRSHRVPKRPALRLVEETALQDFPKVFSTAYKVAGYESDVQEFY